MKNAFSQRLKEYNALRTPADRTSFCHAPSVNLNFEQTGNVTACCYNRRFILGNYPKNSIMEIWQGAKAEELRSLLKKGDLSRGCELCKHQLEAGNFSGLRARGFDGYDLSASEMVMPRVMEFETSNICNYECIMCNGYFSSAIRRNREKLEPLPAVYDDSFVEQLRPFIPHLKQMKFLGGEPFLNPLYYKIWELAIEVNPDVETVITTNGSILNNKSKALVKRLKPSIVISMDSLDPEVYASIRKNGNLETVLENLEFFKSVAHGANRGISIAICPMKQNWHTIPALFKFCNDNDICLGVNTVVWPPESSLKTLSPRELKTVFLFLTREGAPEMERQDNWLYRYNATIYLGMLNQIQKWTKTEDEQINAHTS